MEEIEDPTESIQEHLREESTHQRDKLGSRVALTAALLAVFGAVTSLLSGHHANEAMIEQIKASDQWSYFQAKGIKSALLATKQELLLATGHAASPSDEEKSKEYKTEQKEVSDKATELEQSSERHLAVHLIFARGVTMFQVAIAIAAIAALSRRRRFWYLGLGFGVVGFYFLISGLLH